MEHFQIKFDDSTKTIVSEVDRADGNTINRNFDHYEIPQSIVSGFGLLSFDVTLTSNHITMCNITVNNESTMDHELAIRDTSGGPISQHVDIDLYTHSYPIAFRVMHGSIDADLAPEFHYTITLSNIVLR